MFSRRTAAGITLSALALATFGTTVPSGAAETALSLTLTNSGALSIAAPANASGTSELSATATNATIAVDGVTVTDARTLPGVFTATAVASDLSNGTTTISKSTLLWVPGTISGGLAVPAGGSLGTSTIIAVGPGLGLGASTYTINGSITVPILNATPGTYTGTLTTSVS